MKIEINKEEEQADYNDQLETAKKVVKLFFYMIQYKIPFDSELRCEIEKWNGSEYELLLILRRHTLSTILCSFDSYAYGLAELLVD